jgi:hypothetical protein
MARIIMDKKTGNPGLIRCAIAGSIAEKTLASALAEAFSQHISAWKPSATRCFSQEISGQSRGICVAN